MNTDSFECVEVGGARLYRGDCLEVLPTLAENSIDSVVTDTPAGISFMGKDWDKDRGGRDAWVAWMTKVMRECLRVLKPGGHALVWALPRTSHWTGWAIEEAGFEIRDRLAHLFGSGFPKSLDVSKAIDRAAGAERKVIGKSARHNSYRSGSGETIGYQIGVPDITAPATDAARRWSGWGTALKPACEDWWLCRKPLSEKTVAANVLRWGTGALNIDACRIETNGNGDKKHRASAWSNHAESKTFHGDPYRDMRGANVPVGRWPANVTHDGSDEVLAGFPAETSYTGQRKNNRVANGTGHALGFQVKNHGQEHSDRGSASRFFACLPPDDEDIALMRFLYCPKASKADRDEGLDDLRLYQSGRTCFDPQYHEGGGKLPPRNGNHHPTVKATPLMRWLCRLITPPGGIVLDPFMGSGSTGKACMLEVFNFIGIEKYPEYFEIAKARIEHAQAQLALPMAMTVQDGVSKAD